MNKLYQGKDISKLQQDYCLTQKDIERYLKELKSITQNDVCFNEINTVGLSNEEISMERNKFKKFSWKIIQKANEILIDKLNQLAERERHIDRILNKIEDCLYLDDYDKTQMAKLMKMLENAKQNSITELARVIQILYDKQDDKVLEVDSEESLETLLGGLVGEEY